MRAAATDMIVGGTSWWYFESADNGCVTRQVEEYASGALLRYDILRNVDAYGGLALDFIDRSETAYLDISGQAFEQVWESACRATSC
jgi:hypothetical protein